MSNQQIHIPGNGNNPGDSQPRSGAPLNSQDLLFRWVISPRNARPLPNQDPDVYRQLKTLINMGAIAMVALFVSVFVSFFLQYDASSDLFDLLWASGIVFVTNTAKNLYVDYVAKAIEASGLQVDQQAVLIVKLGYRIFAGLFVLALLLPTFTLLVVGRSDLPESPVETPVSVVCVSPEATPLETATPELDETLAITPEAVTSPVVTPPVVSPLDVTVRLMGIQLVPHQNISQPVYCADSFGSLAYPPPVTSYQIEDFVDSNEATATVLAKGSDDDSNWFFVELSNPDRLLQLDSSISDRAVCRFWISREAAIVQSGDVSRLDTINCRDDCNS